jgi:predicted transcriptional regulator
MKLKIKGLKKEMSTTGTGASFTPGAGEQYSSPKSFKKRDEIGEPFTTPNPSIPNRKSKFIDYKKLFEKTVEEVTNSQADAGLNTGIDMDSLDAASVLELAKVSKGDFKIGDTAVEKGTKYTVVDIDPVTGRIEWSVENVPAFDSVYKEFDELRKAIATLDRKTDDEVVDDIAAKIKAEFNRYRTHIRKNYPEEYKRFQTNENINEEKGVSRGILLRLINNIGPDRFADIIADLRDENLQDQIVAAMNMYTKDGTDYIKPDVLNEARYSQFKTETKLRTPTEQIHRAVREIRRKIDEIVKVVGHTERMKSELKQSNEGMSYLKRTRNAINTISEKLQELNNRIKGLTE